MAEPSSSGSPVDGDPAIGATVRTETIVELDTGFGGAEVLAPCVPISDRPGGASFKGRYERVWAMGDAPG